MSPLSRFDPRIARDKEAENLFILLLKPVEEIENSYNCFL
jgi:hypothetical protein